MAERADLVVKNGKIVSSDGIVEGGVAIKDGKFIAVGKDTALPDAQKVLDIGGKHILPGLIDPEVHLGIHRPITADLISETKAAASTGVTTWGMQLTSPNMQMKYKLENDPSDIVSFKDVFPAFREVGEKHSRVDFFLTPILANDGQAEDGVPRSEMEVKDDVWKTISGFSSRVEAYMQVMLSLGVNQGRISLERLVELCCENNAKVFGLFPKKGTIRVGSDGDLVVVDLNKKATVRPEMLYTSSGWSIYEGWEFTGWPVLTIVRGHVVAEWSDKANKMEMVGEPVGRYVPRTLGSAFLYD